MDLLAEPFKIGDHIVPGVWRFLFPDDLSDLQFPKECGSSCSNCPKVVEEGFHPDYRCCTYHPRIPNFLVGLALEDPATAPLMEAAIAGGFATPEGLLPTTSQTHSSLAQRADDQFGKTRAVVCRFLDQAKRECRIYKYRNAVCSTFFCTHDHEDAGHEFWSKLQAVASQVEAGLSQWAMATIGMNVADYFQRFDSLANTIATHTNPATQAWTPDTLKLLWHDWYGKERAFYLACARLVREHKERLSEIPGQTTLRTTTLYDRAARVQLTPAQQRELDMNEGSEEGDAVPPADLWYLFQVTHRNLWRLPDAGVVISLNKDLALTPNSKTTPVERYHAAKPWIAAVGETRHFLGEAAHAFLQHFATPRPAANDWLLSLEDDDPRALLSELLAKKLLVAAS